MSNCEKNCIKNLEDLVSSFIKTDKKIVDYEVKRLTAPGENYGSLMLAVIVKVTSKEGKTELIHLVAKKIPETEYLQRFFQIDNTYRRELELYRTIIPTLIQFQREQGVEEVIDFIPKFYGGRISLNPHAKDVDRDAVIILENLKLKDYVTGDRIVGFDFDTAQLILRDLAVFHAVPIALKLSHPDVFQNKVLPYVSKFSMMASMTEKEKRDFLQMIKSIVDESEECKPLADRIEKRCTAGINDADGVVSEDFATVCHNDYWVNNTMIKYSNGKVTHNKFVDFQFVDYGSPGRDVIFFLFASVQHKVINDHYDDLITLYYNEFVKTLRSLNCDISPFTYKAFLNELEVSAKNNQFAHIVYMLQPICASLDKELEELTEEDAVRVCDLQKERTKMVVRQFAKRNWL